MARSANRLLVVGAHPDDAEFHAGGLMCRWAGAGGQIKILCLTNGAAGHHQRPPAELARVRQLEASQAADLLGAELEIWTEPDGGLEPRLALREKLIASIRAFNPALIVTHRPADYHPDHRAAAQLVQDACYLLQVPHIVPEAPPLQRIPPVLLAWDRFTYPRPFRADWVIDTGEVLDTVVALLACHVSQVYEWLPHTQGISVPGGDRRVWLRNWYASRPAHVAKRFAPDRLEYAEAFEVSEYGGTFAADDFVLDIGL